MYTIKMGNQDFLVEGDNTVFIDGELGSYNQVQEELKVAVEDLTKKGQNNKGEQFDTSFQRCMPI